MQYSVAMCTYNGAAFVSEQIASIANQTCPPAELVVCDDRSSDDTIAIVQRLAPQLCFPVRILVNPERLGSTGNFEKAVGLCTAEVVALADQDDVWPEHKAERILALLAHDPAISAVFTDALLVDEKLNGRGTTLWHSLGFDPASVAGQPDAMLRLLQQRNVVTGATLMFRQSLLALIPPIPQTPLVLHDWWIGMLAAATGKMVPLGEPLLLYRQHGGQQVGASRQAEKENSPEPAVRAARYEKLAKALDTLLQRLQKAEGAPARPSALALLAAQRRHLRTRAELSPSRLRRLPSVLREVANGGYQRYSRGLISAVGDLLRNDAMSNAARHRGAE